jgi:hypothetical protein
MAAQPVLLGAGQRHIAAEQIASFPNLRVLAWDRETLYASRGYTLLAARPVTKAINWQVVGRFHPPAWRRLTSLNSLSYRLVRDGFHALAVHPSGNIIAAVPGAITTLRAGEERFVVSHRITRGTRPLHITAIPNGTVLWGEYFDNPHRDEVHIYASSDAGVTWNIAHTFPKRSIRHIHNIVYDQWANALWIFTGDYGAECRILRASLDFRAIDEVISGDQQARAVASVVTESGLFFATDTPLEQNYVKFMDRSGRIEELGNLPSSSIYGCQNRAGAFFSSMAEPSERNPSNEVNLFGGSRHSEWKLLATWRKDCWPMKFFQYGNAFLPDGDNDTDLLAVTTVAVKGGDLHTIIWRTTSRDFVP